MNPIQWAAIIASAVETAIRIGKELGIPTPGSDEIQKIIDETNQKIAVLLPLELEALGIYAGRTGERIAAKIGTLPSIDRCPKCSNVMTIHSGKEGRTLKCDKCNE